MFMRGSVPAFGLALLCVWAVLAPAHPQARAAVWQPSAGHVQVPIWPGTPPDAVPDPRPESVRGSGGIMDVSRPTMTFYAPKSRNTGVAVVVFPDGRRHYPKVQTALQDAQRTLGLVRLHAAEWGVDPHKVGVMGFSAGGRLVAGVSTHFDRRAYAPVDAADRLSCRPDFAIALYPGRLRAHEDENRAARDETDLRLRPDIRVRPDTPPTFLVQAENDHVDGVEQSLAYYVALQKARVPTEMHLYAQGGHAFGLRAAKLPIGRWPELLERWLHTVGMLGPRQGG